MAGITLTIGAQTRTWAVSAADLTRIVNALWTQYGPIGIGNGQTRPMTAAEVFAQWSSNLIADLTNIVQTTETAADEAAVTPPTPIVAT